MRTLKRDDSGAVAVVVAILSVVLFGIAALVIDVGMLYTERRELQNGADATTLAVAGDCAKNTCTGARARAYADSFGDANTTDNSAAIDSLCSNSARLIGPSVTSCAPPAGLPAGAQFVKARTATRNPTSVDPSTVDPVLSQLLGNEDGVPVVADSVAVWGGPSRIAGELPLTFSYCEWAVLTRGGQDLLPWPTTMSVIGSSNLERKIVLGGGMDRNGTGSDPELHTCAEIAAGTDLPKEPVQDAPGGFGWLTGSTSGCTSSTLDADGMYTGAPGGNAGDCPALLRDRYLATWSGSPQLIYLPVYETVNSTGHPKYDAQASMAFVVTGFYFGTGCGPASRCQRASKVSNAMHPANEMCNERNWDTGVKEANNNQKCITGYFVNAPAPEPAPVGGPSLGVTVFNLFS